MNLLKLNEGLIIYLEKMIKKTRFFNFLFFKFDKLKMFILKKYF